MGKVLFRGMRRLRDEATGEIIETQVVERETSIGDVGFHKLWLGQILELIEEVGNAKMQVLMWLLRQADARNQIQASAREIASGAGVGVATANRLMRALQKADVITRNGRYGVWRLNPDVIFKGTQQARLNVLYRYREEQGDLFETTTEPDREPAAEAPAPAPLRLIRPEHQPDGGDVTRIPVPDIA